MFQQFDVTILIVFVVVALFSLITQAVSAFRAYLYEKKSTIPNDWQWLINSLVDIGCKAAEQVYLGQKDKAAAKLRYALNYVRVEAAAKGIAYDEKQITALIEAKVYEIFTIPKQWNSPQVPAETPPVE